MSGEVVTRMSELSWAMFQNYLHEEDCEKFCPISYYCMNHHQTPGCHGVFFDWFTEGEDVKIDSSVNSQITLDELLGGERNNG